MYGDYRNTDKYELENRCNHKNKIRLSLANKESIERSYYIIRSFGFRGCKAKTDIIPKTSRSIENPPRWDDLQVPIIKKPSCSNRICAWLFLSCIIRHLVENIKIISTHSIITLTKRRRYIHRICTENIETCTIFSYEYDIRHAIGDKK